MRSSRRVMGLLALVLVVAGALSACGGAAPEPAAPEPTQAASIDAEALLQERCTVCHGLGQVESATYSRQAWDETVTRMVGLGAKLNDEEKAVLIDYLTQTYGP